MIAYKRDGPHWFLQDVAGQQEIVTSPTHPCAIYWVSTTAWESNFIQRNSYKDYAMMRQQRTPGEQTSRASTSVLSLKEWIVTGQRSMHRAKLWGWDTDASNVYNGRRVLWRLGGGSKSWKYTAAPRQGIRVPSENHVPVGVRESWSPGEHDTKSSYYTRF